MNFYELMPDKLENFDQKSKLRKTESVFMFIFFVNFVRSLLNATRLYFYYLNPCTLRFCFHTTTESQPSFQSIYQVLWPEKYTSRKATTKIMTVHKILRKIGMRKVLINLQEWKYIHCNNPILKLILMKFHLPLFYNITILIIKLSLLKKLNIWYKSLCRNNIIYHYLIWRCNESKIHW